MRYIVMADEWHAESEPQGGVLPTRALELGNLNRLTYLVVSPLTCQGDLGRALGSGYSRAPQLKREHNMLHGIIAVCPQTGGLLYAKAYAPSFGLPTVCTPASVRRAT